MHLNGIVLDYVSFLLKVITLVIAIAAVLAMKECSQNSPVKFTLLNKKRLKLAIARTSQLSGNTVKSKKKQLKAQLKEVGKLQENLYVINFKGDIKASEVNELRDIVTSIIEIAMPSDRVLLKIESPGGEVSAYGLVASQIARFRSKNIHVTASIDQVAASGGYLIASVADNIIAAHFAIIGSIGVILQSANINKLLKKNDVDIVELTSGKYKRTLTTIGENTKEGKEKAQEQINSIHETFKSHVANHRPEVSIESVANGEIWLSKEALELKLIDSIQTSDDFISNALTQFKVFNVTKKVKKSKVQNLKSFCEWLYQRFATEQIC